MQCTTEFSTLRFAAQTKEGGKIKGWDKKEVVGNELLGNAFFPGLMPILRYNRGRQAARLASLLMLSKPAFFTPAENRLWCRRLASRSRKTLTDIPGWGVPLSVVM